MSLSHFVRVSPWSSFTVIILEDGIICLPFIFNGSYKSILSFGLEFFSKIIKKSCFGVQEDC